MIDQKDKLYAILMELYPDVLEEYKFDWLTNHSTSDECAEIYKAIKLYRKIDFLPNKVTRPPCDYIIPSKKIVLEYDEIQHFTYQRQLALEAYPKDIHLNYDKNTWIKLCKTLHRKMNKAKDPYRDEKRAFYDSLRDILIPKHGYKLVRIYHGQINFDSDSAKDTLIQIINSAE